MQKNADQNNSEYGHIYIVYTLKEHSADKYDSWRIFSLRNRQFKYCIREKVKVSLWPLSKLIKRWNIWLALSTLLLFLNTRETKIPRGEVSFS